MRSILFSGDLEEKGLRFVGRDTEGERMEPELWPAYFFVIAISP